ncbi:MAG: DUF2203 domain-containing protein [Isosphaeraceae bacterium]|nr:DUF2203 domain-containing protein [Isosphaeraceae bacterium]
MPFSNPDESKRRFFTVEEANKSLPYITRVVSDIVRQNELVNELRMRMNAVMSGRRKPIGDVYTEELAQSQSQLEAEEFKLGEFINELTRAGVELKGPDGLCDFPSLRDGRVVYLCWRLGEPSVAHWHELDAGFSGRQAIEELAIDGNRYR